MRFDDSVYRILGSELEALTNERTLMLDQNTYFRRSTRCANLPGALIKSLRLTL